MVRVMSSRTGRPAWTATQGRVSYGSRESLRGTGRRSDGLRRSSARWRTAGQRPRSTTPSSKTWPALTCARLISWASSSRWRRPRPRPAPAQPARGAGLEEVGPLAPDLLRDLPGGPGSAAGCRARGAAAEDSAGSQGAAAVRPLRGVGLAALVEIVAFEFMLSRVSGRSRGRWRPPGTVAEGPGLVHPPRRGRRRPRRAGPRGPRRVRLPLRDGRGRGDDHRRDGPARERLHPALFWRAVARARQGDALTDGRMRIAAATIYALRIPFVESFSHGAQERRSVTRSSCGSATTPARGVRRGSPAALRDR